VRRHLHLIALLISSHRCRPYFKVQRATGSQLSPSLPCIRMTPGAPLELPEIASVVAGYCRRQDLAQCLRVCKPWYLSFLPCLWKDVTIKRASETLSSTLWSHRQLIASIAISKVFWLDHIFHYPNLRRLTLQRTSPEVAGQLIKSNTMLSYLELTGFDEDDLTGFWETAAADLLHLNNLVLTSTHLPLDQSEALWQVCARMESIVLDNCTLPITLPAKGILPTDFPRLRRLTIELQRGVGIWGPLDCLLQRSSQLETLTWVIAHYLQHQGTERIAEVAAQGTWPKLERMAIHNDSDTSDEDIGLILSNMQRAVRLSFADTLFGDLAFGALRGHFGTITHLYISFCNDVTSAMVSDILCSCRLLTSLVVDCVLASDVMKGKPWICLSLKVLDICFLFSKEELHLNQLLLERLSSLVQLEELYLNNNGRIERIENTEPLDFCLHRGLSVLASLSRLSRLKLENKQPLGVKEAEWMVENWKRLERIDVNQNSAAAKEIFRARGIRAV